MFTDPVAPGSVASAVGRTGTIFLDALGRPQRKELPLGADYGNQTLIVGQRTYDPLGRVAFEAAPFPSSQSFSTSYGTTYYYHADGTPDCFVQGSGVQSRPSATPSSGFGASHLSNGSTNETAELYQTCFATGVSSGQLVVSVTDAAANLAASAQAGVTRNTAYTAAGRRVATWTDNAFSSTVSHLDRVEFGYDALGRMVTMTRDFNPAQGSAGGSATTSWHYDSLGQVIELDVPDNAPQFRTYDDWGELTQVQWTDTSSSSPVDRRSISRFDALGRIAHREDQTAAEVEPRTVNDYAYDTGVNNAMPPITATNMLGRLALATSPTSSVSFSYSPLGALDTEVYTDLTDTSNNIYVAKRSYHGDGSLSALDLTMPDRPSGDAPEHASYAYDSAGRMRNVTFSDGEVTKTLFSAAGTSAIDVFGRTLSAQYGASTYSATYASTGRRLLQDVKVTAPSPLTDSREISFAAVAGTSASVAAFDPLGRERVRQEFMNGSARQPQQSAYDSLGRLTFSQVVNSSSPCDPGACAPPASLSRQSGSSPGVAVPDPVVTPPTFSYDPLGNITQKRDPSNSQATMTLSYQTGSHDLDRLCSVAWNSATPPAACNVLYDGTGNVVQDPSQSSGTRTLSYFPNGQVSDISNGGTEATFEYDAFGAIQQLVLSSSTSPDTRHDKHFGKLIYVRDEVVNSARQSVITRLIPGPGGLLATRHGTGASSPWTFTFGEDRGARFVTDQDGHFVQDVDYQPFGEVRSQSGAQPGSPQYQNMQWNGGDALAALGLTQLGARIYDPALGRFLSRDPILVPHTAATANPYAFANNDPINGSDPSGLMPCHEVDSYCDRDADGDDGGGGGNMGDDGLGSGGGGGAGAGPTVFAIPPVHQPPRNSGSGGSGGGGDRASALPFTWASLGAGGIASQQSGLTGLVPTTGTLNPAAIAGAEEGASVLDTIATIWVTLNVGPELIQASIIAGIMTMPSDQGSAVTNRPVKALSQTTTQAQTTTIAKADTVAQDDTYDDNDVVVRAGVATAEQLQGGAKEHVGVPGLVGFSVQYAPGKSVEELAAAGQFPNLQISVTTVGALLAVGIPVVPSPGQGFHNTAVTGEPLSLERAAVISSVFVVMPNPAPRRRR